MPTIWIPPLLRKFTDEKESIQVAGTTLREVIDALEAIYPALQSRLCQGDQVRPGLSIVIDGQVVRGGLSEPVNENSEVHFIPAIGGGSP